MTKSRFTETQIAFVLKQVEEGRSIAGDPDWLLGVCFATLASMLYAGSTLSSRTLKTAPPTHLPIIHCCFGVVVFAPFLSLVAIDAAPDHSLFWLLGLDIVHISVIYIMIYSAYPKLSVAVIGICALLNPLAAIDFGYAYSAR